jgi:thioredoxin reductase
LENIPYLFYRFSQEKKDRYLFHQHSPAAAAWLRDRVIDKVHFHEGQTVESMEVKNGGVDVTLSNGETLHVDHIALSTGYKVDVTKLPMLHPSLASQITSDSNVPVLSHWYETSVPGLYFTGLTSMRAFGPLYRLVVGASSSGRRIANAVARYVRK